MSGSEKQHAKKGGEHQSSAERAPAILLFGPPGSGKGTLGKSLGVAGGHVHLSSGEVFRSLPSDSPQGELFHKYASKGHLVPDPIVVEICSQYIRGLIATGRYAPTHQKLLLDGVPRTATQAEQFEQVIQVVAIIVLEVSDVQELIRRLQRRAHIEGRQDDLNLQVLRTRMEVYQAETARVLDFYPPALIHRFRADKRPIEVLRDVLDQLAHVL